MIDNLKLLHPCEDIQGFISMHRENLVAKVNLDSEGKSKRSLMRIGEYRVEIVETSNKKGYIIVRGSLHKAFAHGKNFSRFTFEDVCSEIGNLESLLGIDANQWLIQNLEIGVNVATEFEPYFFLRKNLLLYRNRTFKPFHSTKDAVNIGFQSNTTRPVVKIYDKSKQYKLDFNLLRYELRYKKSDSLKLHGITRLADLLNRSRFSRLTDLLLMKFDSVLMYDPTIDVNTLGLKDQRFVEESKHVRYWEDLIDNVSSSTIKREKARLRLLSSTKGSNMHWNLRQQIAEEIEKCMKSSRDSDLV